MIEKPSLTSEEDYYTLSNLHASGTGILEVSQAGREQDKQEIIRMNYDGLTRNIAVFKVRQVILAFAMFCPD